MNNRGKCVSYRLYDSRPVRYMSTSTSIIEFINDIMYQHIIVLLYTHIADLGSFPSFLCLIEDYAHRRCHDTGSLSCECR